MGARNQMISFPWKTVHSTNAKSREENSVQTAIESSELANLSKVVGNSVPSRASTLVKPVGGRRFSD